MKRIKVPPSRTVLEFQSSARQSRALTCFLLALLALPVAISAQTSPDDSGSQAVNPTVAAQTAQDVKWLFALDGRPASQLAADKRFEPLLAKYFANTEVTFWSTKSAVKRVPDVAAKYLRGSNTRVAVEHNRYVVASGCVQGFCEDKGLLWVDAHIDPDTSQPGLAFAVIDVRAGSTHLWLYSNKDFYNSPFTIPQDLRVSIGKWLTARAPGAPKRIDQATLVDPTGQQQMDVTPALLGVPLSMIKLAQ
ncbi:MAG: hypothetical protein ACRD3D_12680 [Terriglobia bacterium]